MLGIETCLDLDSRWHRRYLWHATFSVDL